MINEYIKELCDILNIAIPTISYNTKHFPTPTMMAQCNPPRNIVYLRQADDIDADYLFSIAHELRHLWQFQTDKYLYFFSYKTVDAVDIETYNNQPAEIDANAFASIIMVDYFHLKPLYHGLSDDTINLINNQISYIVDSLIK